MIDPVAAQGLVKRTAEITGGVLLRLFTEELEARGVPVETINAAIDAAGERMAEALRRQRAGEGPEEAGPLVLPDLTE